MFAVAGMLDWRWTTIMRTMITRGRGSPDHGNGHTQLSRLQLARAIGLARFDLFA